MGIFGVAKNVYRGYKIKTTRKQIVNANHSKLNVNDNTLCDMRKYGFSMAESQLFDLKNNDCKNYISTWEAYQPRIHTTPYFVLSDDKYLFASVFGKFIEVPVTYALINNGKIEPIDSYQPSETLYDFILRNKGAVIKDRCGCDGFDVYVLRVKDGKLTYKDKIITKEWLNEIVHKFRQGMVQSIIQQGDFENELFCDSVNTVRIVSLRKKDRTEHEIVGALQRIGTKKSAPVDNFNQGGGSALIDLDTGELGMMTSMFSVDLKGNRVFYEKHPDSGAQIKGQKIPNWDELKNTLIEITRKLPFFECIAWDVVIKNDGFALIETNMKSSLNVFQIHKGMRNELLGQKYREHGWLVDSDLIEKL